MVFLCRLTVSRAIGIACFFLVLSFFLYNSFSFAAAPYDKVIAEGRAAATEAITDTGASSVSLAFVDGDKVVWAETFGFADKESATPPTADTMYAIGSTSKILAALAVMKLVDGRKISLDAPLTRYMKSFAMASPKYRQVTVRHLLNHGSGFPGADYRNAETASPFEGYPAQVKETLQISRLKHDPGFMNVYCNDCFTLVEELIQAVTGKKYAQFLQDEVFDPLAMGHTRCPLEYFPPDTFAQRYSGATRLPQLFVNTCAAGGLYSTPTDMARVAVMLIDKGRIGGTPFLSKSSVSAMGVDQTRGSFNPVKSYTWSYGLGLDSVQQPGLKAVGIVGWHKGGDTTLYGSAILMVPGARLAAIVIGASGSFGSDRATLIAERILLRALAEKKLIRAMPTPLEPKSLPLKTPSPALLAAIQGYYAENTLLLKVEPGSDKSLNIFWLDAGTNTWKDFAKGLKLRIDGRFASDDNPGTAYSFKTAENRTYLITRTPAGYKHYQDDGVTAQKVAALLDLPDAWSDRCVSGRKWLLTNEHPQGPMWTAPRIELMSVDNLLFSHTGGMQILNPFLGTSMAGMMLLIPQMNGRDINDFVLVTRGSEEWVRSGSYLYRPRETMKALNIAGDTIKIGPEGLSEWRSLALAAEAAISVVTSGRWRLFDSNFRQVSVTDGAKVIALSKGTHYLVFHSDAVIP